MIAQSLFDARVSVAEMDPRRAEGALYPEERQAVARAADRRLRQFTAGRQCARRAMEMLSYPSGPILQRSDRAPSWPADLVGSITHTDRWCAVAVARRCDGYEALGIDLEPAEPMPTDLYPSLFRSEELRWLEGLPSAERGLSARAIFSAKEAAFKLQYALSGVMLEFDDLSIAIGWKASRFVAILMTDCAAPFSFGDEIEGRIALRHGHIGCGAALTSAPVRAALSARAQSKPRIAGEIRRFIGAHS